MKQQIFKELLARRATQIAKERVYVDSPEEAPAGVQVQQGDQGGLWYPSEAVEGEGGEEEGGDDVEWVETEYGEVPDTDGPIPPDMRDEPIGSDSHPVLWKRPEGEEELNEYISEIQDTEWYGEGSEIFERAFHGDENTEAEHTNEEGEWDEERLEKHDEWAEDLLNEDAATEEDEEPIGMILLGPPGAGKGWWQEQVEEGAYGETGEFVERDFTAISSDRTKEPIPEYDETNASEVHDEASKIAKENLAPKAIEDEHNVIVDKVATTPGSTLDMIESMREKGYDVRANFVNVPTEKAVHNAVSRYHEEGRFTPLDYANGAGEASRESFNEILDEAGIPDEKAGRFDNDVEWGNAPEAEFIGEELLKIWYELLRKYKGEDVETRHGARDDRTSRSRRDGSGDSGVHGGGLRRGRGGGHEEGGRGRRERITRDDLVDAAQSILKERVPVENVHEAPDDAIVHVDPETDEMYYLTEEDVEKLLSWSEGDSADDFRKEWVSDPTEQAPNRWTNTETGEHRYQDTKPAPTDGEDEDDEEEIDGFDSLESTEWVEEDMILSREQESAVRDYISEHHYVVNQKLRGEDPSGFVPENTLSTLQSMFDKAPEFDEPVTTFRGMTLSEDFVGQLEENVGDTVELEGFQSTSHDPNTADIFTAARDDEVPVMLQISTQKGLPLYNSDVEMELGGPEEEEELLLGHEWEYEIHDVQETDDGHLVNMEVVSYE